MRRRVWIGLSFIVFFILEGTVFPWLIPIAWQNQVSLTPHFVLVSILYLAIFADRHQALLFGLVFGLLQDMIYYGHMLGPHCFTMGMIGYLTSIAIRRIHVHVLTMLVIMGVASFVYEMTIYGIYRMFQVVSVPFVWTIIHQFIPTMLLALLTALLLYVPARHQLELSRVDDAVRKARKV